MLCCALASCALSAPAAAHGPGTEGHVRAQRFVKGWQAPTVSYIVLVKSPAWRRQMRAVDVAWERELGIRLVPVKRRADAQIVIGTDRQLRQRCLGAEGLGELPGRIAEVAVCPALRPNHHGWRVLAHEVGHAVGYMHSTSRCSIMHTGGGERGCRYARLLTAGERRSGRAWYRSQTPSRVDAPDATLESDGYWFWANVDLLSFVWRVRVVLSRGACVDDPDEGSWSQVLGGGSVVDSGVDIPVASLDGWCVSVWPMLNPWQYGRPLHMPVDCSAASPLALCADIPGDPAPKSEFPPWKMRAHCGSAVTRSIRGVPVAVGFVRRDGPGVIAKVVTSDLPAGVTVDVASDRFTVTSTPGVTPIDLTLRFSVRATAALPAQLLACRVVLDAF